MDMAGAACLGEFHLGPLPEAPKGHVQIDVAFDIDENGLLKVAAQGLLKRLYAAAIKRAGKVFNVIRLQSPRPEVLRISTQLYLEVMHSDKSPLSRARREMIATAVSRANDCHY